MGNQEITTTKNNKQLSETWEIIKWETPWARARPGPTVARRRSPLSPLRPPAAAGPGPWWARARPGPKGFPIFHISSLFHIWVRDPRYFGIKDKNEKDYQIEESQEDMTTNFQDQQPHSSLIGSSSITQSMTPYSSRKRLRTGFRSKPAENQY